MDDVRGSGFRERTRLSTAIERLRAAVGTVDRTERVPVSTAVGRTLAVAVTAERPVPHFDRVARDGYAVRAADTFGASDSSPALLRESDRIEEGAVSVEAGDGLPEGADAVVPIERVETDGGTAADAGIAVLDAVAEGDNVEPVGATAERGETVLESGRRLRPSDPALCRSVGIARVAVRERPTVGVLPVGAGLVDDDPAPGEAVETNGLTVATLVDRWGGAATYRDPVPGDRQTLRPALERDLTKDLLVTVGGTAAGRSDRVPAVVDDIGEVFAHGLAIDPGGSAAVGRVRDTPVVLLPGPSVACLVAAVQLLEPAVKRACGIEPTIHPAREGELAAKVPSEPGVRTFARVAVDDAEEGASGGEDALPSVRPVRTGGANAAASVAAADGWVAVPESREGFAAGERVSVQDWEFQP